ncbi:hypothetical protein SAPIO_CDS0984 [Scedosporium apiospermum]|uniref:Histone chaperone domain-containing protein n=1 Tax=Pseudallescheria apiosperma TaxID=563466 RepID=A0A084GFL3_PSEDA|nr:uncharacterized protein SAPIO_CDS0984 [Scedosporium apiospermum]KEZ46125.1 hypothetical protein SAPIO_CDS0984 [Scedosporium apiospermum]
MASNGTTLPHGASAQASEVQENKGKGKAIAEEHVDTAMDEDDDDDDEEEEDEANDAEEEEEDNLDEIDTNNIINSGRRTRGRIIDFAKAAEENPPDDDDDEDDDDFQAPDEDVKMDG